MSQLINRIGDSLFLILVTLLPTKLYGLVKPVKMSNSKSIQNISLDNVCRSANLGIQDLKRQDII